MPIFNFWLLLYGYVLLDDILIWNVVTGEWCLRIFLSQNSYLNTFIPIDQLFSNCESGPQSGSWPHFNGVAWTGIRLAGPKGVSPGGGAQALASALGAGAQVIGPPIQGWSFWASALALSLGAVGLRLCPPSSRPGRWGLGVLRLRSPSPGICSIFCCQKWVTVQWCLRTPAIDISGRAGN